MRADCKHSFDLSPHRRVETRSQPSSMQRPPLLALHAHTRVSLPPRRARSFLGGFRFYENTVSAEATWFNPLMDNECSNPVAQIFAENWVEWDDRREEELEQVAGFDALVDRSRFEVGRQKGTTKQRRMGVLFCS